MKTLLFLLLVTLASAQDYCDKTKAQLFDLYMVKLTYAEMFPLAYWPEAHLKFAKEAAILEYLYTHYDCNKTTPSTSENSVGRIREAKQPHVKASRKSSEVSAAKVRVDWRNTGNQLVIK